MSWSVDRLGRSLQDLIGFLSELHAVGADLYLHQQGIDTTTPAAKAMFQMMGIFAEFERSMIQERVKASLNRAKAQGKTLGWPKVKGKVDSQTWGKAAHLHLLSTYGSKTVIVVRVCMNANKKQILTYNKECQGRS